MTGSPAMMNARISKTSDLYRAELVRKLWEAQCDDDVAPYARRLMAEAAQALEGVGAAVEKPPAPGEQCAHGGLRRKCEICQRDEEIERLREREAQARELLEQAFSGYIPGTRGSEQYVEARDKWLEVK